MLRGNRLFNASMVVFEKSKLNPDVFQEIIKYKFCGDWLFWIYFLQNTIVCEIGTPMNFFRKHNLDVSGKSYLSGLAHIEQMAVYEKTVQLDIINTYRFKKLLYLRYIEIKNTKKSISVQDDIIRTYRKKIGFKNILKFGISYFFKDIKMEISKFATGIYRIFKIQRF